MIHRSLVLAACLLASFAAEAVSTTAKITAQSALIGLQLSAKKRAAQGTLPAEQNACIQALQPTEFQDVAERVVMLNMSKAEVTAADEFFNSVPGRKYATHSLLGIYTALGETPPEPYPGLSAPENKAIETFVASPAGQALFTRQVLQTPTAREAYDRRAQELVMRCQKVMPARPD